MKEISAIPTALVLDNGDFVKIETIKYCVISKNGLVTTYTCNPPETTLEDQINELKHKRRHWLNGEFEHIIFRGQTPSFAEVEFDETKLKEYSKLLKEQSN